MSMKGSAMFDRWKRARSSSGTSNSSGTASASTRPTTASPSWKDYHPEEDKDFQKVVEDALLMALSSEVFRSAVTSQIEPLTGTLSRQSEKLNQIKTANLNVQSIVEDKLSDESLAALLEPSLNQHLAALTQMVKEIPSQGKEMADLLLSQKTLVESMKSMDRKMSGLESQVQDFGGRMQTLEDQVVNSDLRSAIRFGEISNELQDRNTVLVDRLWGVERDLGKKVDGQQRRVVDVCEELGKTLKTIQGVIVDLDTSALSSHTSKLDTISSGTSQMGQKMESMERTITKLEGNVKSTEQTMGRDIHMIRDKVSALNTSALETQAKRLDAIDRGVGDVRKEIQVQGTLASLDSKLLSTNTSRLDTLAANLSSIGRTLESLKEQVTDSGDVQTRDLQSLVKTTAGLNDNVRSIQSNVEKLDTSLLTSHSEKLEELIVAATAITDSMKVVREDISTIDTSELPKHAAKMDTMSQVISNIKSQIDTGMVSHSKDLTSIHERLSASPDTSALEALESVLKELKSTAEDGIHVQTGMLSSILAATSAAPDTSISSLHGEKLSKISENIAILSSNYITGLDSVTKTVESVDKQAADGLAKSHEDSEILLSQLAKLNTMVESQQSAFEIMKQQSNESDILAALSAANEKHNTALNEIKRTVEDLHSSAISEMGQGSASVLAALEQVRQSQTEAFEEVGKVHKEIGSAVTEVNGNISSLDAEVLGELEAMKSAADGQKVAINQILQDSDITSSLSSIIGETKENRDALKQITTTLAAQQEIILGDVGRLSSSIERYHTADAEALKKHFADLENVTLAVPRGSEDSGVLGSVHELSREHSRTISEMLASLQAIKDNSSNAQILTEVQSLKQLTTHHISALATASNLSTSEESVCEAIHKLHSTVERELLDNRTAVTSSINDLVSELKIDLKGIGARISTATNVIRADMKDVNIGPAMLSLAAIAGEVAKIDAAVKESGRVVESNATVLTKVNLLLEEQLPLLSNEIRTINLSSLEFSSVETRQAVQVLDTSVQDVIKTTKAIDATLTALDEKVLKDGSTLDLTGQELAGVRKAIDNVDIAVFRSAQETRDALKSSDMMISEISGIVSTTRSTFDRFYNNDMHLLHKGLLQAINANEESLNATRTNFSSFSTATQSTLEAMTSDLHSIPPSLLGVLDSIATSESITEVLSELKAIVPAIRINAAALSRVDKSVLETGAQIKSVVYENQAKTSEEIDAALEQLDESIHDAGTRIRGISEFDMPRLETNIKGIDTTLDRLTKSTLLKEGRNRDALEVIGSRIVGTRAKFDELVESHAAKQGHGKHEMDDGAGESMESSRTLGTPSGKGDLRLFGARRTRGGSNASSSKPEPGSMGMRMGSATSSDFEGYQISSPTKRVITQLRSKRQGLEPQALEPGGL